MPQTKAINPSYIPHTELALMAESDAKWWLRHYAANKTSPRADSILTMAARNMAEYGFHKRAAKLTAHAATKELPCQSN